MSQEGPSAEGEASYGHSLSAVVPSLAADGDPFFHNLSGLPPEGPPPTSTGSSDGEFKGRHMFITHEDGTVQEFLIVDKEPENR